VRRSGFNRWGQTLLHFGTFLAFEHLLLRAHAGHPSSPRMYPPDTARNHTPYSVGERCVIVMTTYAPPPTKSKNALNAAVSN
jgi:hypothetical protein